MPVEFTTATAGSDDDHCTIVEISCVDPSLNNPVAVNCCMAPRMIVGEAGVTWMLWIVAVETVNVAVAGLRLPQEPVIVTDPLESPVATPERLITASL